MSTGAKDILNIQSCVGSLKSANTAEAALPITFGLRITKSGQGLIEINTSAPAAIGLLTTFQHEAKTVQLIAHGPNGEYIEVMDADISNTSVTASNAEQRYNITARLIIWRMRITSREAWESAEGEAKSTAEYFVKGLERTLGFHARQAPWSVAVNSENKAEHPNTISARMVIELDKEAVARFGDDFEAECDELAERVLEVLSVSVGTSLSWAIRKTFVGGRPTQLFFRSTQEVMAPSYPVFHSLNLAPALDLALTRHTPELRKEKGLDVAIYWSLNHSPRAEAYYLHLMTALEHMVSQYSEGKSKARFDKKEFANNIRPAFYAAARNLREQGVITDVELMFLEGKLGEFNRLSLRDSVEGMLREWGIRFEDLASVASIAEMIAVRNIITHRGALPDVDDDALGFWRCLDVLVELIKRIFMGVWGYQGRYISHLGEYHEAIYPPANL